jgi:hypothetical protein
MIKSKRMGWAEHVSRVVEKRNKSIPSFRGETWREQTTLSTWGVKAKIKLALKQATKAQRVSRCIALLFL